MSYASSISALQSPNVKAFLDVVAWAEGADYNTLFGGGSFNDYSKHPNRSISAGNYTSTAAGRYQFLYNTWVGIANKLGLPDFSPQSQDIAAVELINQRGALSYLLSGDLVGTLQKLGCAWASLPYSGCGQGERTLSSVISYFTNDLAAQDVSALNTADIQNLIDTSGNTLIAGATDQTGTDTFLIIGIGLAAMLLLQ